MVRNSKIHPETQDNADQTTAAEPQARSKARRPRRMVREAAASEATETIEAASGPEQQGTTPAVAPAAAPRSSSKIAAVVALLERAEGATLPELVKATGWLPHTTRAALTGLKKKGRIIARDKRGEVTCYRIEAAA